MPYLDKPLQNLLRLALVIFFATAIATLLSSCGEGVTAGTSATDGDVMLEAVLGSVDSYLDEVDSTLGTTQLLPMGSCIHAFTCVPGAPVLTRVYSDCNYNLDTSIVSAAKITGSSVITFNSQASCVAYRDGNAPVDGTTVAKNMVGLTAVDVGRDQSSIVSSAAPLTAAYASNKWSVTLPEITRTSAAFTYRLKTQPATVLEFTGARKTSNRQLSNGKLTITDATDASNLLTYSMSLSFLQWKSPTCCLPTFGAIELTSDTTMLKTTFTFDGAVCNQFKKTAPDGTTTTITVQTGCE